MLYFFTYLKGNIALKINMLCFYTYLKGILPSFSIIEEDEVKEFPPILNERKKS